MNYKYRKYNMESLTKKSLRIAAVVSAYWFISISLVFLNKYLLSSSDLKFDAPIFVTWFQCLVSVLICYLLAELGKRFSDFVSFPECKFDLKVMLQIMPLSIIFVLMILFNNLCLKYVGVSFYYVNRSLSTVFNVIFTYFILNMTTSWKALLCCFSIIMGFLLGVNQESITGTMSIIGVVYGVLASALVALNAIYTKKCLSSVDNNIWSLTYYNNVNASFIFVPLILFSNDLASLYNFSGLSSIGFWGALIISGIFGFAIGYITGLQIQVTSPLTHNISGTAKACSQTVLACLYYAERKTYLWWTSNLVVLAGSFAYTIVKRQEMKEAHAREIIALTSRVEEGHNSK